MGEARKILVIEDDRDLAEIISENLQDIDKKLEVFVVQNPKQAYALLKEHSFWGVITDLRMPEESGIEFLEKTKNFRTSHSLKTLVLSGFIPHELCNKEYNNTLFRAKPISQMELTIWLSS